VRNPSAWLVVFCLVALGAKLWTIQIWATNIPYWDQWDEARLLFKPWLEGTLTWHDFFIPHNEHRIVFTRLLDLLEVKLNGQWDPMFQMVVNALIHVAYGCGLAAVIWNLTGRKYAGPICVLLLPFFALPFAAENTIHGFQSQMYLLNIFSAAGMIGLGFGKPGGGIWFCGLVGAALAIFTMASGFLAAAALVGLIILRSCKQRGITRGQILTLLCGLAVVALGLAMKVSVGEDKKFQANTLLDFCRAFLGNLAWPFSNHPTAAVLFCLPLAVVIARYFQRDFKNPRAAEFVLMFGLWGFLQAAALAFGRANLGVSSRYFDTLSTIPIADVAAIFVLADDPEFLRLLPQKFTLAAAILWLGILLAGLCECSRAVAEEYSRQSRLWGLLETENVRAFVATDDPSWLKSTLAQATPYWNADWLIDMLRQPEILSIMPADARPSLKLEPDETLSAGFSLNDFPAGQPDQPFATTWGDDATNQVHSPGHFVSQPLSARLPKLAIQLYRGTSPRVLIQFEEASGRTVELHPQIANGWQTLIVNAPQSPFRFEIKNPNVDAPVAVGEIKELGRFSVTAQNLVGCAVWVLFAGLFFCVILAGATLAGSAVSFGSEGVVWLLILLIGLVALAGTWCWRDLNATEYTVALQKYWSVQWASAGFPGRAELHLREALWLRPNDIEAAKELGILQARSGGTLPPEKIP
jgi:hypothetical protein